VTLLLLYMGVACLLRWHLISPHMGQQAVARRCITANCSQGLDFAATQRSTTHFHHLFELRAMCVDVQSVFASPRTQARTSVCTELVTRPCSQHHLVGIRRTRVTLPHTGCSVHLQQPHVRQPLVVAAEAAVDA
jgi:hypothetical protein